MSYHRRPNGRYAQLEEDDFELLSLKKPEVLQ